MDHCRFHQRGLVFVVLLAFVFFAVQAPIHAQTKQVLKLVLIDSGTKGLSKSQAELFFTTLQKKVSQYEMLSVFLESDLKKELNPTDKAAFDKCFHSLLPASRFIENRYGENYSLHSYAARRSLSFRILGIRGEKFFKTFGCS